MLTRESQSQKVFVFLCAELCRSAFSGIVTRGKYYRPYFTELLLESSLTRIHRKTINFAQSDSGIDNDTDDVPRASFTLDRQMQTVDLMYL